MTTTCCGTCGRPLTVCECLEFDLGGEVLLEDLVETARGERQARVLAALSPADKQKFDFDAMVYGRGVAVATYDGDGRLLRADYVEAHRCVIEPEPGQRS